MFLNVMQMSPHYAGRCRFTRYFVQMSLICNPVSPDAGSGGPGLKLYHMGKLQTAQCPLLVNLWTRRHSELFPDRCPQGGPWAQQMICWYIRIYKIIQGSPLKTQASISHTCVFRNLILTSAYYILKVWGDFFKLKVLILLVDILF